MDNQFLTYSSIQIDFKIFIGLNSVFFANISPFMQKEIV